MFISTRAIFDERIFPYCSRGKEDGPAPIPVEEENPGSEHPQAEADYDSSQVDDHRLGDPDPRRDVLLQQPVTGGTCPP